MAHKTVPRLPGMLAGLKRDRNLLPSLFAAWLACGAMVSAQDASSSEIYKCSNASGGIEFRDWPCDSGTGARVDVKENTAGTGADLASIRAQDAQLSARIDAQLQAYDRDRLARGAAKEQARIADQAREDALDYASAREYDWPYYGYAGYYDNGSWRSGRHGRADASRPPHPEQHRSKSRQYHVPAASPRR